MPRHITPKLPDIKDREKLLEAARGGADDPRELEADFPAASVDISETVPSMLEKPASLGSWTQDSGSLSKVDICDYCRHSEPAGPGLTEEA